MTPDMLREEWLAARDEDSTSPHPHGCRCPECAYDEAGGDRG